MEVADAHTYFAGELNVWAHNVGFGDLKNIPRWLQPFAHEIKGECGLRPMSRFDLKVDPAGGLWAAPTRSNRGGFDPFELGVNVCEYRGRR